MSPRQEPAAVRSAQETRVRWWAVALPLAAFVALFSLLVSPAAAGAQGGSGANPVLEWIGHVLPQVLLNILQ